MKKPRILFFDTETSYVLAGIFRTGKNYISHEHIIPNQKFDIICIAYRWLDEHKTKVLDWGKKQNSGKMIDDFGLIVSKADVVIAHNGAAFDIKQVNTQRLLHGQRPIDWPVMDDTLKALKKYFYFPTYKLDYISKVLTGEGKSPMSFVDWVDIIHYKKAKALAKMKKYCVRDVDKLVEVYKKIEPFLEPKVNVARLNGVDAGCPKCGHAKSKSKGRRVTISGEKYRRICGSCGYFFSITATQFFKLHGRDYA